MSGNKGEVTHPYQLNTWIDVSKPINKYQFLKDSRFGSGGYRNGKYLIPHKRESVNDYDLRRSKSFYANQYRPIWSAHFKPIFKGDTTRIIDSNTPQVYTDLYNVFLANADGKGSTLQSFIEQGAGDTKNLGASFLVMNNNMDIDTTIEEVLETRDGVPYAFIITPDMVHSYTQDSFGNLSSLKWYQQDGSKTFNSLGEMTDLGIGITTQNLNKFQYEDYIVVGVDADNWVTYESDGITPIEVVPNEIGVIPVIRLVEEETNDIIPEPSLYSVARMQHRIFNHDSIITDVSDNQGFSIFTMPSSGGAIEYSATKGISYPSDSNNKPEFISPDAQQLKTLLELGQSYIHNIYQAGVVNHLQRFQQSAESKEIDRARLNDLLGSYKSQIESAENQLMKIFGLYVGFDYGYSVHYSDDYGVSTLSELILNYVEVSNVGIDSSIKLMLEKSIASTMLDFSSEEEKQDFLDSLDVNKELDSMQMEIDNQLIEEDEI